jgi:FtsP/CotA-like multicopper oxidase with cupredoxin domain
VPAAASAVQAAIRPAGAQSGVHELPAAPEVRSVGGVAYLKLTAAINPSTNLPAFYFANQTVPPTIRVWPGDTLVIDYTNNLPASSVPLPDMTNLHTHGLTDSPQAPGDQVIMTMIAPGQTYRYVFAIPKTQPPGLYWYHPHPHGESNRQVASGMSGLIIVGGIESYAPAARGLAERDILLRDYYFNPSKIPLSRSRRNAVMHEVALDRRANPRRSLTQTIRSVVARGATLPANATDCNLGDASYGVTINGVNTATITMAPRTRQLFRIANTSANSQFDIEVPGQQLYVVAYDGVPLSFHNRAIVGQWASHVLIPTAGRAEVIVSAPTSGTANFQTRCINTGNGAQEPGRTLATIQLGTPPQLPAIPTFAAPPKPEPFGPIAGAPIVAERSVVFSEDDSGFYINGQFWNPNSPPMFVAHTGTVESWTIYNYAKELHIFHIHQVHFLVEDVNGVKADPDTWRDSFPIPYAVPNANGTLAPGVVHVLLDFRDPHIAGTFVFHCHILEHEDDGMMAKIQVIGPGSVSALYTHGYREGFLTANGRRIPAACKRAKPSQYFCGCDGAKTVSLVWPKHSR